VNSGEIPEFIQVSSDVFYSVVAVNDSISSREYWRLFNRDYCSSDCDVSAIAHKESILYSNDLNSALNQQEQTKEDEFLHPLISDDHFNSGEVLNLFVAGR